MSAISKKEDLSKTVNLRKTQLENWFSMSTAKIGKIDAALARANDLEGIQKMHAASAKVKHAQSKKLACGNLLIEAAENAIAQSDSIFNSVMAVKAVNSVPIPGSKLTPKQIDKKIADLDKKANNCWAKAEQAIARIDQFTGY